MKKLFPVLIVTLLMLAMGNNLFSQVTTIPAGASPYPNLGAAFTAINAGGPYTGAAVTVTITANLVEPAPAILNGGVFTSLLLKPSGIRTVTGNFNDAIIVLNGADNVTIDGTNAGGNSLSFSNTDPGLSAGSIRMSEGAQNNIVRNCTCMGVGTANAVGGRTINIAQSTNGIGNNNNIIENNVVNGGRRGIQTFGTAPSATTGAGVTNDNTIIRNNIVKNCSALHIFVGSETINNTVLANDIFNDALTNGDIAPRAIALQGVGVNEVRNNRIHDVFYSTFAAGSNGLIGIISIPITLTAPGSNATTINIINNFVAYTDNNNPAGFIYGIAPLSNPSVTAYTANVYNNSAHIGGATSLTISGFTAALEVSVTTVGSIVNTFNNIAINSRTGGIDSTTNHIGDDESSMPVTGVTFNTDYNFSKAYDTTGRGFDGGYAGRIFRGDGGLELMKDTACINGNGQHNMYKRVNFVTPTNLHLAGPIGGDICGKPLAAVTTDIDLQPRNASYPYRGADEGATLKTFTMGGCLEGSVATDQVTVVLKSGACGTISSCTADITPGAAGTAVFCFGDSVGIGPYYIDVQNRNHLETYSASTVVFGGATVYDFKTARTQAFGSNLTASGPPFCFYGGDRNQDGNVNLADLLGVYNDATAFVNGCRKVSDIDNNGFVNLPDILITFNNVTSFVVVSKPCPEPSFISTSNNSQNSVIGKENNNNNNTEILNREILK